MIDLEQLKFTRFRELPLRCDNAEPGLDETEEWRDWTALETTPDQQRIENYLAGQALAGKSILHVGVGNSSLAQRFSGKVGRIVGTTITRNEEQYGNSLKLPGYSVEMNNKYSGKPLSAGGQFDYIVDNNPSTFACCLTHLMAMLQFYEANLAPAGQLLTDRAGLGWVVSAPDANPRWKFDFDDLAMVAQQVGLKTFAIDNNIIAVSRVRPRPVQDFSLKGLLRPIVRPCGGPCHVCAARLMLDLRFTTHIIHWRGPSPFYFAPVPADESRQIAAIASKVTYGWGVIPVEATVGRTTFSTSLFPKDGAYLLPLKAAVVRKSMGEVDDQHLQVAMTVGARATGHDET